MSALSFHRDVTYNGSIPPFEPHPWLKGAHAQTFAGVYWPAKRSHLPSTALRLDLPDGDALLVEDSVPPVWKSGDPVCVLLHGLAGSSRSHYIKRIGSRLYGEGIRVFRMNYRSAGPSMGLSRKTYHGGNTDDVRAVFEAVAQRSPGSPIAAIGFSLGASLALKMASETASHPVVGLDCVIAANPPLDFCACSEQINKSENWLYQRKFVVKLKVQVRHLHSLFPELGPPGLRGVKTLLDFDSVYTAPRNGFRDATDYYTQASTISRLHAITSRTFVVHALDDPFIPPDCFRNLNVPSNLELELLEAGGHLGYIGRTMADGDRRWLDARLLSWLKNRWM